MSMADRIREKLAILAPHTLNVTDDSGKHAGHAGARPGGETHFSVAVVSDRFAGMSRVERYRLVHALLEAELRDGVHALSLNLKAPQEG
jgi:BolA family transcriptional regulator, general stress-responsive regulator